MADRLGFETDSLVVRPVAAGDREQVARLFDSSADYFELVMGHPPGPAEAESLALALPEGCGYEDKHVLGAWHGADLVGVVDLIRDYPEPGTWLLGLILLAPGSRRQGLGSALLVGLERWVADRGGERLRAAVAGANHASRRFFAARGYRELERRRHRFGLRDDVAHIVVRDL